MVSDTLINIDFYGYEMGVYAIYGASVELNEHK